MMYKSCPFPASKKLQQSLNFFQSTSNMALIFSRYSHLFVQITIMEYVFIYVGRINEMFYLPEVMMLLGVLEISKDDFCGHNIFKMLYFNI